MAPCPSAPLEQKVVLSVNSKQIQKWKLPVFLHTEGYSVAWFAFTGLAFMAEYKFTGFGLKLVQWTSCAPFQHQHTTEMRNFEFSRL